MDAARSGVDLAQEEGEVLAWYGCAVPAADRLPVRGSGSQAGPGRLRMYTRIRDMCALMAHVCARMEGMYTRIRDMCALMAHVCARMEV